MTLGAATETTLHLLTSLNATQRAFADQRFRPTSLLRTDANATDQGFSSSRVRWLQSQASAALVGDDRWVLTALMQLYIPLHLVSSNWR